MILIADSGSTKTTWVLTGKQQKNIEFHSQGINPYTQSKEQISKTIKDEVIPKIKDIDLNALYFYGAGCSTAENKKTVRDAFKDYLKSTELEIEHDLLGAARALWFDEKGLVAILGTGSNSCVYDGKKIVEAIPSLGYILGDEGSGAYLGKILMCDYLYKKMPDTVHKKFHEKYGLDGTEMLDRVYKKENPNRWLATFAHFVSDNISESYCQEVMLKSLRDFFENHLVQYRKYQDYPLGVNGSIGFVFKDYLETVSKEFGFRLGKIIKAPIDEMVKYHLSKEKH